MHWSIEKLYYGESYTSRNYEIYSEICHPIPIEKYNEIKVVFIPANRTSILQFIDQHVILTFKSYYLGNTFHEVIAAIDSNSPDAAGQSELKTF